MIRQGLGLMSDIVLYLMMGLYYYSLIVTIYVHDCKGFWEWS